MIIAIYADFFIFMCMVNNINEETIKPNGCDFLYSSEKHGHTLSSRICRYLYIYFNVVRLTV